MARFHNTKGTAEAVILAILDQQTAEAAVLLQQELVDMKRDFKETEAAQTLFNQFQKLLVAHKAALIDLEQAARKSSDPAALADLMAERQRIETELDKTFERAKSLKLSFGQRFMRFFQKSVSRALID